MPISKMNRHKYPPNWKAIRQTLLRRAGGDEKDPRKGAKCEQCDVPNYAVVTYRKHTRAVSKPFSSYTEAKAYLEETKGRGDWISTIRISVIVLTIAHLNHDPEDNRLENLRAWCQRCHLTYDLELHKRNAAQTRLAKRNDLELFTEWPI